MVPTPPMYMPGLFLTASNPSNTVMLSALYCAFAMLLLHIWFFYARLPPSFTLHAKPGGRTVTYIITQIGDFGKYWCSGKNVKKMTVYVFRKTQTVIITLILFVPSIAASAACGRLLCLLSLNDICLQVPLRQQGLLDSIRFPADGHRRQRSPHCPPLLQSSKNFR